MPTQPHKNAVGITLRMRAAPEPPAAAWVTELGRRLPHITENIVSETIVTAAINDGLQARRRHGFMALGDKGRTFAERMSALPGVVTGILDDMHNTADAVEAMATELKAKKAAYDTMMGQAKEGMQAAIGAVNQMTNGGDGSGNG